MACFAHDGSYLGNLALSTNVDDRLLVEAGAAKQGFAAVELNGQPMKVGDQAILDFANNTTGSVRLVSSHELSINASFYQIDIENSDGFLNLKSVQVPSGQWAAMVREAPHGLLGQTWRVRGRGASAIEGDVDDYVIAGNDVFGSDFMHNKFCCVSA